MKISIITYLRAVNYGSALQAYALNQFLRDNGYDARTINYTTEAQQDLYKLFEPLRGIMSIARNLQSVFNFHKMREHNRRFQTFISDYIPTTKEVNETEALKKISYDSDYFVCGSDQIWNANCDDFDSNYMLSFVENKNQCIAYAPSLGGGVSSMATKNAIKNNTSDFKALSARENTGAQVVAEMTGRDVTTVADPVLLLSADQWRGIASPRLRKGDYILGYFIGDVRDMRKFANDMRKKTGLQVVVIYKNLRDIKYGFKNLYESGPADFISLVMNSKGIVTNSFHAVAFSLVFKKDFWAFTGKRNADTRITGLLNLLNLSDRIIDISERHIVDYLEPIPYARLNYSSFDDYIAKSKEYLLSNLV